MDNAPPSQNPRRLTLTEAAAQVGISRDRLKAATLDGRLRFWREHRPGPSPHADGRPVLVETKVVDLDDVQALLVRRHNRDIRVVTGSKEWREKKDVLVVELRRGCTMQEACRRAHVSNTTINYLIRHQPEMMADVIEARTIARHARIKNRRPPVGSTTTPLRVYAIAPVGGGPAKFGITRWPARKRMLSLQVGSPVPLEVVAEVEAPRSFETWLHAALSPDRSHGEWFRNTPRVRAVIALMQAGTSPITHDGMVAYKAAIKINPLFEVNRAAS